MRDHILRVTAPAQEEVSNILVVSLSLIVHLGLYRRGGLTPAQLAVEGLTLNIQDKRDIFSIKVIPTLAMSSAGISVSQPLTQLVW